MTVGVGPDVPARLVGDPLRLRQVLLNLVGNAIKFTERGEVRVKVCRKGGEGDRVLLDFEVHDSGIGIRADKLGTVFSPFEQADGSTTRKYGGTGLGLSIARLLVDKMEGRIGAVSEVGRGSVFHFSVWLGVTERPHALPVETGYGSATPCLVASSRRIDATT